MKVLKTSAVLDRKGCCKIWKCIGSRSCSFATSLFKLSLDIPLFD